MSGHELIPPCFAILVFFLTLVSLVFSSPDQLFLHNILFSFKMLAVHSCTYLWITMVFSWLKCCDSNDLVSNPLLRSNSGLRLASILTGTTWERWRSDRSSSLSSNSSESSSSMSTTNSARARQQLLSLSWSMCLFLFSVPCFVLELYDVVLNIPHSAFYTNH